MDYANMSMVDSVASKLDLSGRALVGGIVGGAVFYLWEETVVSVLSPRWARIAVAFVVGAAATTYIFKLRGAT